jgi:hypothetical protein
MNRSLQRPAARTPLGRTQQGRATQYDVQGRPYRSEINWGPAFNLDPPAGSAPSSRSPAIENPSTPDEIARAFRGPVPQNGETTEQAAARMARMGTGFRQRPDLGAQLTPGSAPERWARLTPEQQMAEFEALAESGRPELMGTPAASALFNRAAQGQQQNREREQRYAADDRAIQGQEASDTDRQRQMALYGMGGPKPEGLDARLSRYDSPPIAQDPEQAENVSALRGRLGGDLGVQRQQPGSDVFNVSSRGSGGMGLLMGGRGLAEQLSPTRRAPGPAGPDATIYRGQKTTDPAMSMENWSPAERAGMNRQVRKMQEQTIDKDKFEAFRSQRAETLAGRQEGVIANAKRKADERALRRPGALASRLLGEEGGDQFENALQAAAMMPGNPMAPEAGRVLAMLRANKGNEAGRAADRQIETDRLGLDKQRHQDTLQLQKDMLGKQQKQEDDAWAMHVQSNPDMFSLEDQQTASGILSRAPVGQTGPLGNQLTPPIGIGGRGPVDYRSSGVMVDPMLQPQLDTLAKQYHSSPEDAGPGIVATIQNIPQLSPAQQEKLLRSVTKNPHATMSDPTGKVSAQAAVDRLRSGRQAEGVGSSRGGWGGYGSMGRGF